MTLASVVAGVGAPVGPRTTKVPTTRVKPAATAEGSSQRPPARRPGAAPPRAAARAPAPPARARVARAGRRGSADRVGAGRRPERSTSPIRCQACRFVAARHRSSGGTGYPGGSGVDSPSASAESCSDAAEPFSNPDDMSLSTSTHDTSGDFEAGAEATSLNSPTLALAGVEQRPQPGRDRLASPKTVTAPSRSDSSSARRSPRSSGLDLAQGDRRNSSDKPSIAKFTAAAICLLAPHPASRRRSTCSRPATARRLPPCSPGRIR